MADASIMTHGTVSVLNCALDYGPAVDTYLVPVGSDDVQIKFRAPKALRDAIERAADRDMSSRTATAWLISAALQKLKDQGVDIEGERKKKGGK
jgi:hypothetical protein